MENEKLFEFMEKMYTEMQSKFKRIDDGQEELKLEVRKNNSAITSLEDELKEIKKTLYDVYVQNTEAIKRLEKKVDELSERVDRHDIKIQVIEGGKKAL